VPFFVAQAEQMGIQILPPDVNLSDHRFVVVDGNIRFGLDAVKGVGFAAVEAIKEAREKDGPFTDLWDFCTRIDNRCVNKKAIEGLIKCGAFGSTGATRKGMLSVLEAAQQAGQKAQQDAQIGQGSIFDGLGLEAGGGLGGSAGAGEGGLARPSHALIPAGEFERTELLALEKESVGLFISAHPLKDVAAAMVAKVDCSLLALADCRDGDRVTVGGIISQTKRLRTKKGDPMMFATLDDLEGSVEMVIFGQTLEECAPAIEQDAIVLVKGRIDHKDKTRTCVVVQSVDRFAPSQAELDRAEAKAAEEAAKGPADALRLRLDAGALPATVIDELRDLLISFPGESEVVIELSTRAGARMLRLGSEYRVERGPGLHAELEDLLGSAILAPAAGGDGLMAGAAA
jgi:DNA polymerase-3 subunit alpha